MNSIELEELRKDIGIIVEKKRTLAAVTATLTFLSTFIWLMFENQMSGWWAAIGFVIFLFAIKFLTAGANLMGDQPLPRSLQNLQYPLFFEQIPIKKQFLISCRIINYSAVISVIIMLALWYNQFERLN